MDFEDTLYDVMDTAHRRGIAGLGMYAALKDERKPDFRKYAK